MDKIDHAHAEVWARDTLSGKADGTAFPEGDLNLARCYLALAYPITHAGWAAAEPETWNDARARADFERFKSICNSNVKLPTPPNPPLRITTMLSGFALMPRAPEAPKPKPWWKRLFQRGT